ncbi:hypothetical protein ACIP1G_04935 [Pseudomonas sp. NPDC089392]|uniref:hypothetical protein n=1 Tax=Pseudomonas sp. NPDC089392 TaxID=3364459 RepID=UPI0037FC745D
MMVHEVEDGDALNSWALTHRLDALVWTALPPRYQNIENRIPMAPEAAEYLMSLDETTQAHARDYLNKVPGQIYTAYRQFCAERLGW